MLRPTRGRRIGLHASALASLPLSTDALDPVPPDRWLDRIRDVVGEARMVRRLQGGEEATVHQLDTEQGAAVLHISPAWRSRDELAWVHRLLHHVKATVPEAVAPIGKPGETVLDLDGHCAALYPFVEGERLDREDPLQRDHAARCLAAIHRATRSGFDIPRPAKPGTRSPVWPDALRDPELDAWWAETRSHLTPAPIHGDYYRGNLLCRGRQLVGILDWHDARVAPLALELAAATVELCMDASHALRLDRARAFVQAYLEADAPISPDEIDDLIPLMRVWVRRDAAQSFQNRTDASEQAYALRQLEVFHALRGARLDVR